MNLIYIGDFLKQYKVKKIKYLKIDTEGYDLNILNGLYNYLLKLPEYYHPIEILFETNYPDFYTMSSGDLFINELNKTLKLYYSLNYELVFKKIETLIKKIK